MCAQTILFRDNFNGTELDSTLWNLGTWQLGRTPTGQQPRCKWRDCAPDSFDTYLFRGTEIWSKKVFARETVSEIEARV